MGKGLKDRNQEIKCKCGICDVFIQKYDIRGRERFFAKGHHNKYKKVLAGRTNYIKCKCGNCNVMIAEYDNKGRKRRYELGHYVHFRKKENRLYGEKHPRYKGHRWKHKHGYIYVKIGNHPRARKDGYVLEHILVLEKKLGRYLTKDEQSHHINGIRDDNRPENLTVLHGSEHGLHHSVQRWKRDKLKNKLNPKCLHCNNDDVRKEGFLKTETERKQKYYCNNCKRTFMNYYQVNRNGLKVKLEKRILGFCEVKEK